MGGTRVVHNSEAYAALIKHPAVQADLERRARNWAQAAGGAAAGIVAEGSTPHTRARAAVVALRGDPDNVILRSMGAAR